MAYFFSASKLAFFDDAFRADYQAAGSWPADAKQVSDAVFQEFALGVPPAGKVRGAKSGKPTWVDAAPPSADEIKARLTAAVQAHLDAQARAMGYDDIYTAVSYAEEPAVPIFQLEGRALRAWRSLVWAACRQALAEVQAGQRDVPAEQELIELLPTFEAPASA